MSIDNEMQIEFITKEIKLGDKKLTLRICDDNLFEHYFDVSELESKWHTKEIGKYHFSQILGCLRAYYWFFKLDLKHSLITQGIFLMGNILHRLIQEYKEKKYGFVIIERPCVDECEDFDILGKVDMIDILEHREEDIKTTSWMPIFVDLDELEFEKKYGRYFLQILGYAYFLNHTYFSIDPLKTLRIILVDKMTLTTKIMEFDYEEELAEFFYLKIRARAKHLHSCLISDTPCIEGLILDKNCLYCKSNDEIYCPKGAKLVKKLTTPVVTESIEFKKKYGMNKKPFWKFNENTDKWQKTKEFVKFLKEEKGLTIEQIEEIGW